MAGWTVDSYHAKGHARGGACVALRGDIRADAGGAVQHAAAAAASGRRRRLRLLKGPTVCLLLLHLLRRRAGVPRCSMEVGPCWHRGGRVRLSLAPLQVYNVALPHTPLRL